MDSTEKTLVDRLTEEIRNTARSGGHDLADSIEKHLEEALKDVTAGERVALLEKVAHNFAVSPPAPEMIAGLKPEASDRLISLLLGKEVAQSGLSPEEMSTRLARSLKTIFDTLNQTIGIMKSTLLGQAEELETIRIIIDAELKGENTDKSLQAYLDQIQETFLLAHKAFGMAGGTMMGQVLAELDPEKILALPGRRLKFGPLRKAELFDIYCDKFRSCKSAFESGHLMAELLREFEKACQKLYKKN